VEQWFEDLSETLVSADWTLTEFHSAIVQRLGLTLELGIPSLAAG
jgi:hypothetical protein